VANLETRRPCVCDLAASAGARLKSIELEVGNCCREKHRWSTVSCMLTFEDHTKFSI